MEKRYCNKCFKLIEAVTDHQVWCPNKIEMIDMENIDDNSPLKGTIFEDLMNNGNKDD